VSPWDRFRWIRWLAFVALLLILAGFGFGYSMRGDADSPAAGLIDVGFLQDMSVHHDQAVDMATTELTGGADPAVKNLAFDILTTQQNQVGRMQGWLTAWGEPLLPTGGHMAWMGGGHGSHGPAQGPVAAMPGMADATELARLRSATPADRDVLFLQLMLRHHEGGAEMLAVGAEHAETGYVRDLARRMSATQSAESALLTEMLRQRGAPVLPVR
jgi:uncharacterized protein (DUF305 family)